MLLLKRRLFMTSQRGLGFINDRLCGLGRGIVFTWHRLALVQSGSCGEQSVLRLWKVLKVQLPVAGALHFQNVCSFWVDARKSYLLMKHLSLIFFMWQGEFGRWASAHVHGVTHHILVHNAFWISLLHNTPPMLFRLCARCNTVVTVRYSCTVLNVLRGSPDLSGPNKRPLFRACLLLFDGLLSW